MLKKIYWFLFVYDLDAAPAAPPCPSPKGRFMQDLSYIVLFAYTFFIVAPIFPLLSDLIAHTFWEQEHLSTAHHRYGNNHVGIEIQQAEKRADTNATNNNRTIGLDDLVHRPERYVLFDFQPVERGKSTYALFICPYIFRYPDIDYPPPRL